MFHSILTNRLKELGELFFPRCCVVCNHTLLQTEQNICLECLWNLPTTNYHLMNDNPIERRFYDKIKIERAAALFFYEKGNPYQKLITQLKYNNNKKLGYYLGYLAGQTLLEAPQFTTVDLIVPVPLHPNKQKKRGYNQSEIIAKGISQIIHKPVDATTLFRAIENPTQTRKNAFDRWENTEQIFDLHSTEPFSNKHILLIDDVLTTGSTLYSCALAIKKSINTKISLYTIACV